MTSILGDRAKKILDENRSREDLRREIDAALKNPENVRGIDATKFQQTNGKLLLPVSENMANPKDRLKLLEMLASLDDRSDTARQALSDTIIPYVERLEKEDPEQSVRMHAKQIATLLRRRLSWRNRILGE